MIKYTQFATSYRSKVPKNHGTTMVEMPLALWIIILGLAFPLLILIIMSVRFGFFWNAVHEATQQASRCQTFLESTSAGGRSAVDTATIVATKAAGAFKGIMLVPPVKVYILSTNFATGLTTKNPANTKLPDVADPADNVYDIQVELNGKIAPLVPYPVTGIFGSIQGLTAPFPVKVKSQSHCEYPQGLGR